MFRRQSFGIVTQYVTIARAIGHRRVADVAREPDGIQAVQRRQRPDERRRPVRRAPQSRDRDTGEPGGARQAARYRVRPYFLRGFPP